MGSRHWPFFDLEVRTPTLTLRYADDDLVSELIDRAAAGIHPVGFRPFGVPWTELEPPEFERGIHRFHWTCRAGTTSTSFRIPMAVIVDGVVVGGSDINADEFPTLGQVETGSWLGLDYQGRGLGKEARLATLTLAFDGLGAQRATTAAWSDNHASLGVTRSLGYRRQGTRLAMRGEGQSGELVGYVMERGHFDTIRRADITLHGIEGVRDFLELS